MTVERISDPYRISVTSIVSLIHFDFVCLYIHFRLLHATTSRLVSNSCFKILYFDSRSFHNMASKYHEDWQSSKKTISERNAYMFNNELMSDVSFTCGESSRIFHAHKYVLATSSAVFFAMFYGDLAQRESIIRISDTDEKSFEEFLRFLYTDECKITAENAIGVMYLAKKYLIPSLAEKCSEVLEENVKPDDVFMMLEQAIKFDEKKLEEKCWDIVSTRTLECINSEAFCSIGSHVISALLKRKDLTVAEVELFKAVLKWADSECGRQGITDIEENKTARRRVLDDSVYDIYFLDMSLEEFTKYVSSTGILTEAEVISIFQKFGGLDVADLKWNKLRRRPPPAPKLVGFNRFKVTNLSNMTIGWGYSNFCSDAITLTVNKAVLFHGVRLFGDASGTQYKVKFEVKNENVTGTYTSEQDKDGVWGYDVMLPKPISVKTNEEFTIVATIQGPQSYYGQTGKSSMNVDGTVVTFQNTNYDALGLLSNGTYSTKGQFHKIFLSNC